MKREEKSQKMRRKIMDSALTEFYNQGYGVSSINTICATENISKGEFTFANWEFIDEQLDYLLNKLKSENYLEDLSKEDLSKRLAFYLSELNVLHPFREGNGRTIREFIRELAYKNGYVLDLTKNSAKEIFDASVKSVYNTSELEKILLNCLIKIK